MLLDCSDKLKELLSGEWSTFRKMLVESLSHLPQTRSDTEIVRVVDEMLDIALATPARALIRKLMSLAAAEISSYPNAVRSIDLSDVISDTRNHIQIKSNDISLSEDSMATNIIIVGEELAGILQDENDSQAPLSSKDERHINVWISRRSKDASLPLQPGKAYKINFKVGLPVESNLLGGPEIAIHPSEVPSHGLDTEWIIESTTVKLEALTPDTIVTSTEMESSKLWRAKFSLFIPSNKESKTLRLKFTPQAVEDVQINIINILIYDRKELYRQFKIKFIVEGSQVVSSAPVPESAMIYNDVVHTPAAHLELRTTHEWTTPPGELLIAVIGAGYAFVKGDAGLHTVNSMTAWHAATAKVADPIKYVRASAESFRAEWEDYLNDIDPNDLIDRLGRFSPQYDWGLLNYYADYNHQQQWDDVSKSPELWDLASEGYNLYESFFPSGSDLRTWLDLLPPGQRIDISWLETSGSWIPHVPWGLMYQTPPDPGNPIDPTRFLGLRYRIGYTAHQVPSGSKALGSVDEAYAAHMLYWGDQPGDQTGAEARWQQQQFSAWTSQVFVPSSWPNPNSKAELVKMLYHPFPTPMPVIYIFCQSGLDTGGDEVLRFGLTNNSSDVLKRTEIGAKSFADRPLVFANACATLTSDPYFANELERKFFSRGCRAYLGTETKVPIQLASRFAHIFFSFFYRKVDPQPMAAGEALAQTRLFLWTNYKNIGGLLYTYVNQYELFMAKDNEVVALRR